MTIYEAILDILGNEFAQYPYFMMFFACLFSAFIIYSIINIISTIFKWIGGY